MQADTFDEREFFSAIANSGARALLIGRQAMSVLGMPMVTADYDIWIDGRDLELLNRALLALDMVPNHSPEEARARGRYVIENGEHVDVMLPKEIRGAGGASLTFDAAWERRTTADVRGVDVAVPCIDDLIVMKRIAGRPKDIPDVRVLEAFRSRGKP